MAFLIFRLLVPETVLDFLSQKPPTPSVSVGVHVRVVATATASFYLRREKINLRKGQKRQPDWRMKRVFLFLPPPLTHHHPDSNSRLRRPRASYSTPPVSLARRWKNTTRMTGPRSTHALAVGQREFTMATGEYGGSRHRCVSR